MKYKITLNDKVYEVEVEKGEAILAAEYEAAAPVAAAPAAAPVAAAPVAAAAPAAAPAAAAVGPGEVVPSPLPGTVIAVKVAQGASVKKGDIVMLIEAMKMENEITAPRDGVINQIVAAQGAAVDSGAPLFVMG